MIKRDVIFYSVNVKAGAFPPERSSLSGTVSSGEDVFQFQKLVIASPKYTQIVKSKWKEAFGELMKKRIKEQWQYKNDEKNVNFKPEVLVREEQRILAANTKILSSIFMSAASMLSLDKEDSDSVSSVD